MTETSNKNYLIFLFQRWTDSHVLNCFSSLIKKNQIPKVGGSHLCKLYRYGWCKGKNPPPKTALSGSLPSFLVPESFGDTRGTLYYQPKQCTIKGKSLKFTIDLREVWSPDNGSHLMIPGQSPVGTLCDIRCIIRSCCEWGSIPTNQKHLLTGWLGKMMFSNLKSLNVDGIYLPTFTPKIIPKGR